MACASWRTSQSESASNASSWRTRPLRASSLRASRQGRAKSSRSCATGTRPRRWPNVCRSLSGPWNRTSPTATASSGFALRGRRRRVQRLPTLAVAGPQGRDHQGTSPVKRTEKKSVHYWRNSRTWGPQRTWESRRHFQSQHFQKRSASRLGTGGPSCRDWFGRFEWPLASCEFEAGRVPAEVGLARRRSPRRRSRRPARRRRRLRGNELDRGARRRLQRRGPVGDGVQPDHLRGRLPRRQQRACTPVGPVTSCSRSPTRTRSRSPSPP